MIDGMPETLGRMVLSPTRTYAPVVKKVFQHLRKDIHGMIHCSGGGQTKVLHFIDKQHVVKDGLFDTPPLFKYIQQQSGTPWREMYQVFNMGHRLELYVDEKTAPAIIAICSDFRLDAKVIGRVLPSERKKLSINSTHGTFEYS
jgi:phosphoribosylformylglycinamidine cyclo-ligase